MVYLVAMDEHSPLSPVISLLASFFGRVGELVIFGPIGKLILTISGVPSVVLGFVLTVLRGVLFAIGQVLLLILIIVRVPLVAFAAVFSGVVVAFVTCFATLLRSLLPFVLICGLAFTGIEVPYDASIGIHSIIDPWSLTP